MVGPAFKNTFRDLTSALSYRLSFPFELGFQLGKAFLDGIKEWRVRRQQAHLVFGVFKQLFYCGCFSDCSLITEKCKTALVSSNLSHKISQVVPPLAIFTDTFSRFPAIRSANSASIRLQSGSTALHFTCEFDADDLWMSHKHN